MEATATLRFVRVITSYSIHYTKLYDLLREFKVEASVGRPQVAYRETVTRSAKREGRYVRQTGGRGQFGHVWITVEPNEQAAGFVFESKIVGGVVPREFVPAVEKGIREASENGVVAGYPVVDVKVTLVDGSYSYNFV